MFYDKTLFPWLGAFEANWETIREEMLAARGDGFLPYVERHLYNFGWSVYGLYAWGIRLDVHCEACPRTSALLDTIPGVFTAGFSRLDPMTHIRAHRGGPEGVLRLHLPLISAEGATFRVAEETRPWIEGEAFVFDDCLEHEAWNRSDVPRVVLLVDFPALDLVHIPPPRKRVKGAVDAIFGAPRPPRYRPDGAALADLRERRA